MNNLLDTQISDSERVQDFLSHCYDRPSRLYSAGATQFLTNFEEISKIQSNKIMLLFGERTRHEIKTERRKVLTMDEEAGRQT